MSERGRSFGMLGPMSGFVPTVLRASLACVLGVGTSGCGAVDAARARLDALLGDEPASATTPADAADGAAEPVVVARASEAGAGGEASGAGTAGETAGSGATGGEAAGGSSAATGPVDPTDDTGLPMSYARPPEPPTSGPPDKGSGTAGDDGGASAGADTSGPPTGPAVTPPATPEPTGPAAPPAPVSACLEGEWDAEDLHTYFRRDLLEQAHGRTLRHRGESGRHRLRISAGVLHGKAEHRRMTFDARLANVDIRYTVDVHGEFEAAIRSESPDVLVVDRPTRTTLRAREVVRFSAEKSETRSLELPVEGRWQVACTPGTLELRPLEDGKPGPALRFVRPKP